MRGSAPSSEEDAALFEAIRSGNLTALGVLYDRYYPGVLRFILRATAGDADAQDFAHDVFLTAARIASTYDGRSSARPFIFGIAANIVRSRKQKRARWGRALALLETSLTGVFRRTPEDGVRDVEMLNRALARLSEEKRFALVMIELEGLSADEAAAALGVPVATVWTRLHYARAEMRAHLTGRLR